MRTIFARAAVAALTFGFTGISQAIPIQFDFSGTTFDGTRGSGQFLIETDGLTKLPLGDNDLQTVFTDLPDLSRPIPMSGSFSIGSTTYSLNDFLPGGYGSVSFVDDCALECYPDASEGWLINMWQQSYAFGETPPDDYAYRALVFHSIIPASVESPEPFGFIDRATTRPEDILTLPLWQLNVTYLEESVHCSTDGCTVTRDLEHQLLNVDVVTRSVVTQSVPEPGTFGLLGLALGGMLLFRRRAVPRSGTIC